MFLFRRALTARPATPADQTAVSALARFEERVHIHLDWQSAEDWLGAQPFLVAERGRRLVGALACPPAPPDTAWVRVFALESNVSAEEVWQLLWPQARQALEALGADQIAGLSLDGWIDPLYLAAGFQHTHSVVVLTRAATPAPAPRPAAGANLRPAMPADHETIIAVDTAAFRPPWQISADIARRAIAQACCLTVAKCEGQVVGYQLTTPTAGGAHLSRLAVLPAWQGRGLGAALVADMLERCRRQGAREISVNTQDSNAASLAVYERLGFRRNGARYPVYQLALKPDAGLAGQG
jgi:[ribosomal protein S18]-alanine N-acetyltransferase